MFGGDFAPVGWEFCNGQLVAISDYETLFNLIGTTYGGNGEDNFALPDLRGRAPVHTGGGFSLGQGAGSESVALISSQMPSHKHTLLGSSRTATAVSPANEGFARASRNRYAVPGTLQPLANNAVGVAGGTLPHDNMGPYLCVSFIISMFGIYPTQG